MESDLTVHVAALDAPHRRALEEVIGRQLSLNQRLIIRIAEIKDSPAAPQQPPQSLDDWTGIYEGFDDAEIEEIDKIANTRANLS